MPKELPPLPAPPAWGRLADEGRKVAVVRFVLPDRTISIPYGNLTRWELQTGDAQTLTLHTTGGRLTIRGRDLETLRDALDNARLESVRARGDRPAAPGRGEPWIRSIAPESPVEPR